MGVDVGVEVEIAAVEAEAADRGAERLDVAGAELRPQRRLAQNVTNVTPAIH